LSRNHLIACILSLVLIVTLIATGCAKAPGEVGVGKEKPVYGGTLTLRVVLTPYFDDAVQPHYNTYPIKLTNDELWEGDWTKGKAGGYGTGECDWYINGLNRLEHKAGALAESWEIQGKDTIIFHLRKGVKFHNKPPTNGREVTADDVVYSLNRMLTGTASYFKRTYSQAAETTQISAPDAYTVVIKCKPEHFPDVITSLPDYAHIFPKDALEEFGNMNEWKNNIGAGPFVLTEFVPGSVISYERNPNYWQTNPIGPGKGDQLPYLDAVKMLFIPDESTHMAAFRTGQLDIATFEAEMATEFLNMPQLKYAEFEEDTGLAIFMRTDKKDSPYADKRVRQALSMAIDRNKMLNEYFGGKGRLYGWPVPNAREYANAFLPFEKLPKSAQAVFEYNPERAKQLLAEAGYPNGFKAKIVFYNQRLYSDMLQMVKDSWSKVGVELILDPKDYAALLPLVIRRNYDDMAMWTGAGVGAYFKGVNYTGTGMFNLSLVDDPVLNKAREEMLAAYPDEAKVDKIHAEMLPYLFEQCYALPLPGQRYYRFWWPWVKNYSGEAGLGYYNTFNFAKYVWIDQELKNSILGR